VCEDAEPGVIKNKACNGVLQADPDGIETAWDRKITTLIDGGRTFPKMRARVQRERAPEEASGTRWQRTKEKEGK